jgi:Tol biopolymer transport system component
MFTNRSTSLTRVIVPTLTLCSLLPLTLQSGCGSLNGLSQKPNAVSKVLVRSENVTLMVYKNGDPGTSNIYQMSSDGKNRNKLTKTFNFESFQYDWSPDAKKLAYVKYNGGYGNGNQDIYLMNIDGSNSTKVTDDAAVETSPTWSPDGTKIAFVSDRANIGKQSGIYIMNSDGSNVVALVNGKEGRNLVWSPDGKKLAFEYDSVYVINADGTDLRKVYDGSATNPSWSPNSNKIVFTGSAFSSYGAIFSVNADGSTLTQLTDPKKEANDYYAYDTEPVWSPDGSKIAFTSTRDIDSEIYVMNADGSNQINLTRRLGSDEKPRWSWDGSRILFISGRDRGNQLCSMRADGSNPTNLTGSL